MINPSYCAMQAILTISALRTKTFSHEATATKINMNEWNIVWDEMAHLTHRKGHNVLLLPFLRALRATVMPCYHEKRWSRTYHEQGPKHSIHRSIFRGWELESTLINMWPTSSEVYLDHALSLRGQSKIVLFQSPFQPQQLEGHEPV